MVKPADALDTLRRHMLVDGYDLVLDLEASQGSWLVDARDGRRYLDLFSFVASLPLGMNHPALADDEEFLADLRRASINKPSNSDIYTVEMAEFVDAFARVLGDPELGHLFLVEGGAVAVENALKAAFDWKSRRNEAAGRDPDLGSKVLHLTNAFHGRTGYTMSLTNGQPVKIARYPKFDWPRIDTPAARFPLERHVADNEAAEARALEQARAAFAANPHDIACFIAEPIQGEGGDNHLRGEFLQAMQALCREHDALFILDEVQTGCGMTGTSWAYQQLGVEPDVVAFGKKTQVCGVMAGRRVDEVADNAFAVSSRLNSTWGGSLTDMVRSRRFLEVIESDGLIDRAATVGKFLLELLHGLAAEHAGLVDNVRGRGLLCAVDLPDGGFRDAVVGRMVSSERVLLLGSGKRSVRFRPALTISEDQLAQGCAALSRVIGEVAKERR